MHDHQMNVEDAIQKAKIAFAMGDRITGTGLVRAVLKAVPRENRTRALMRLESQSHQPSDLSLFLSNWIEAISKARQSTLPAAAEGWQYSLMIDDEFLDSSLTLKSKLAGSPFQSTYDITATDQNYPIDLPIDCSPEVVFTQIQSMHSVTSKWRNLHDICESNVSCLLTDSFAKESSESLPQALAREQSGPGFNATILGAGPVGLALANALKFTFRDQVNLLVIENRVTSEHRKALYQRRWLTYLPTGLLSGIIDPLVIQVLDSLGCDGHLGTTIHILESLLLLSNKRLGTKFLFQSKPDLSFIEESSTHLIVDATGGRLELGVYQWEPGSFRGIKEKSKVLIKVPEGRFAGHSRHGITRQLGATDLEVELRFDHGIAQLTYKGEAVKTALFKLTRVPLSLYDRLIEFTSTRNKDSLFYIWPGQLREEINEILILVNLSKKGLAYLEPRIFGPQPLRQFLLSTTGELGTLDSRIIELFNFLTTHTSEDQLITIEPPFLYSPYIRYPHGSPDRLFGRPVLAVGDSIFNGHPKMGNGLGAHFSDISRVVDEAMLLWCIS